jgi:hypothetical protein
MALGIASLAALAFFHADLAGRPMRAARPSGAPEDDWKAYKYQETRDCKQCHTAPSKDDVNPTKGAIDLVLMTEYSIWKTHDKHAQAYAVLMGPRGKRMGELLFQDAKAVLNEKAGCLNCHAMNNLSKENLAKGAGAGLDPQEGVSCGGCHGPSSEWNGLHRDRKTWRTLSADAKHKKGMRDVRDPYVRAQLCMSCHVGNADVGKVVTHAMFAAGHPPLPPIDIATFSRNEPQHWRDNKEVPYFLANAEDAKVRENYHLDPLGFQRGRFALVGGVVAFRESMKLARDRADLNAKTPQWAWPELLVGLDEMDLKDADKIKGQVDRRWPELAMAHSDCYACHHDLKYPGYRQERGFGYQLARRDRIRVTPGRPLIRSWPIGTLELGITLSGKTAQRDTLDARLRAVAKACNNRPFGRREQVGTAAGDVVKWCDDLIKDLRTPSLYTKGSALRFLHGLCDLYAAPEGRDGRKPVIADYETARQVAMVLQVVYDDWRPAGAKDESAQKLFREMTESLNLQPYSRRAKRLGVILEMVRDISGKKEIKGMEAFSSYLQDPKKLGNLGELKKMIDNDFLDTLRRGVDNDEFTKGLLSPKVVGELQKFSDEEEEATLKAVADYDPGRFQKQLRNFAKLLPPLPKP